MPRALRCAWHATLLRAAVACLTVFAQPVSAQGLDGIRRAYLVSPSSERAEAQLKERKEMLGNRQGQAVMAASEAGTSGKLVIEAEGLTKAFTTPDGRPLPIVENFSTRIRRGDRVGGGCRSGGPRRRGGFGRLAGRGGAPR